MGIEADRSGGFRGEGQTGRARDSSRAVRISLILRIWHDEAGEVWGQVVDPVTDRRTPFRGQEALFQVLREHMEAGGER